MKIAKMNAEKQENGIYKLACGFNSTIMKDALEIYLICKMAKK